MSLELHLKITGALLIVLGLAHSSFDRYFEWEKDLATAPLLTRQVFLAHCFFISLAVVLMGTCTLCYAGALVHSGFLSRIVLTGFAVFWLARWFFQLFFYDPAIWRGNAFYTSMHVVFSVFWTYIVVVYVAALKLAYA